MLKAKDGSCDISGLAEKVPEDSARYHLFRFKHNYEGDYLESNGRNLSNFVYRLQDNMNISWIKSSM